MSTVKRVAYAILQHYGEMSHERLQLFTYYSYAHYLSSMNFNLFSNGFQAWRNGPVCLELFNSCTFRLDSVSVQNIILSPCEFSKAFECSTLREIYSVCDVLNNFSTESLAERVRGELPWVDARKGVGRDCACDVEISRKLIHDYYAKNPVVNASEVVLHSNSVENAIRRMRGVRLKSLRQLEDERRRARDEAYAMSHISQQARLVEESILSSISRLREFNNLEDDCSRSRARLIARRFSRQICECEEQAVKRENIQKNLELLKKQDSNNSDTDTNTVNNKPAAKPNNNSEKRSD